MRWLQLTLTVAGVAMTAFPGSARSAAEVDSVAEAGAEVGVEASWREQLLVLDRQRQELQKAVWRAQVRGAFLGNDLLGRSYSEWLRETVLTPPAMARLEQLRRDTESLLEAADEPAGQRALADVQRELEAEWEGYYRLAGYWYLVETLEFQRELWRRTLARVPTDAADRSRAAVTAAAQAHITELRAGPLLARLRPNETWGLPAGRALLDTYQSERQRLAAMAQAGAVVMRTRESPCPPASQELSGTPQVRLPAQSESLYSLYPNTERHFLVEGRVLLSLTVSATGCVESMAVAETSGAPALDEAALAWVEGIAFIPAGQNGVPIASSARLPVRFSMRP